MGSEFVARICVDFDGVLVTGGRWLGPDVVDAFPTPGMVEWLNDASDLYTVAVHSCRSETEVGRETMRAFLAEQGVEVDRLEFPEHKPVALVYLDDRGWRFDGLWPDVEDMAETRPWDR